MEAAGIERAQDFNRRTFTEPAQTSRTIAVDGVSAGAAQLVGRERELATLRGPIPSAAGGNGCSSRGGNRLLRHLL